MSSIKVNLTGGDSYFIPTGSFVPTNINATFDATEFEINGQSNTITNYIIDSTDQRNWPMCLNYAYQMIALNPSEYGYPDLGINLSLKFENDGALEYLKLDNSESMSRVIKSLQSSDTASVDFSLIYSWNESASNLSADDEKALSSAIEDVKTNIDAEVAALAEACEEGLPYTWPDGKVCTTVACCQSYADEYKLSQMQDPKGEIMQLYKDAGIDGIIEKKHIYKFETSGGN